MSSANSDSNVEFYEWTGRTGPFEIELPEGVFRPTYTTAKLAEALRIEADDTVIDMGCGCGVLSIVAARLGARFVHGCDASRRAVEAAWRNAARHDLTQRMRFLISNLFEALPKALEADVVIGDVSGIPDALARATGWYPGGRTGAELPIEMLRQAWAHMKSSGRLYLPTGTIQDDESILRVAGEIFENLTAVAERALPLPKGVEQDTGVAELVREGVIRLKQRGSRYLWTLTVYECSGVAAPTSEPAG